MGGEDGKGRRDDEKNPISRFDPKAKAPTRDDGRKNRRGGGTREEEVPAPTVNIGWDVNFLPDMGKYVS